MIRLNLFVLAMAVFFASSFAVAQDQNSLNNLPPEEIAEFQTELMASALSLNEGQIADVYDINLKYAKENKSLIQSSGRKLKKFKKLKALSKSKDEELEKILTNKQYEIYLQKKEEVKEELKRRRQE